MYILLKEVFK